MNIVIPFHEGDKAQVTRWLQWCEELGGMGTHRLFLMPAMGQKADFKTSLPFTLLEDSYGLKSNWSASNNPVRDASAPNSMIRQIAWHFYLKKLGYWLFCEPDAIPLRPGWHDALEGEYRRERKYYMGALVPGKDGEYPEHMTGVAIWPENAITCKSLILPTNATVEGHAGQVELAFDIAAANEIISGGGFHATKLIQHVFRGPKFEKPEDLQRIDPAAVLFHTDKDGGLINLLRASRGGEVGTQAAHARPQAGSNPAPATPDKPRVHTYFRPCVDAEALAEQKRILAIWEKNWSDAGWEPVILTEAHARKHPDFARYEAAFRAMPTVNPKEYEMACWLRWVAMAQIGGLMVDYDVLTNGFGGDFEIVPITDYPYILADKNPVPCAVDGNTQQYQAAIDAFLTCIPGHEGDMPHLSDQLAVQKLKFPAVDICREWMRDEFNTARLLHFSHARCGTNRSKAMAAWEDDDGTTFTTAKRTVMDEIRERLLWIKDNSRGITRHHVHLELKKLGLLPKK